MEAKEFPDLGFAITNIVKIFKIYKFIGRLFKDISNVFHEKQFSFIALYTTPYGTPQMTFTAFATVILF